MTALTHSGFGTLNRQLHTDSQDCDTQMSDQSEGVLRVAAGLIAVLVAGIHLYWGIPRFTLYASIGTMPDPRPLAFVLSGHAILIGITLVAAGVVDADRLYLPGIGLMAIHLIGYVAWHTVLSHGVAAGRRPPSHSHSGPVALLGDVGTHLLHSPLAFTAAVTEIAVIVLLVLLMLRSQDD